MKRFTDDNNMTILKRLTAILVAVVFVFGMIYMPAGVFAVETDTAGEDAVATDTVETDAEAVEPDAEVAEPDTGGEELNSEAVETDEVLPEEPVAEEDAITDEDTIDELTDALTVDLDSLDENEYDGFIYKLTDDTTKQEIKEMEGAIDELPEGREVEEVIDRELYAADSIETISEVATPEQIESIEPNYVLKACATPNDPGYSNYSWQMENTNIPYVWDRGMTGSGAVVAVLDSGVNINHQDLAGVNFVNKYNVLDGTTNITDDFGHGTKVAGVIAETRNNGIGFVGAMSKTTIMPVKVLNKNGATRVSCVIEAMEYAIYKKADIINMSFGGSFNGQDSIYLKSICDTAVKKGIILVAAAGNTASIKDKQTGQYNSTMYPAAYDCVVSVGSVDRDNKWSEFSTHNNQVTVAAPGENLILLEGTNAYSINSGTSFAAPQVSALAAMLKSRDHGVNQSQFMQILIDTSTDLGDEGYDEYCGYGLINYGKVFDYMATQFRYYSVGLSTRVYDYNGSVKNPAVTVSLGTIKLVKGTHYTATYALGRKAVGTYKVTVKGANGFSGTKVTSFTIRPPLVKSIKAPKRLKKKLTVRWKAMSKTQKKKYKSAITGYQVRVSRNSNFTNAKYAKVKGIAKTKVTVKGLKKKTTYYVQYRSYKTVGSTTYYSKWSSKKKAKTK